MVAVALTIKESSHQIEEVKILLSDKLPTNYQDKLG